VLVQVRCEQEGGQEEDADNLRARLITRQTELTMAQQKIQELLSEKEMLRWEDDGPVRSFIAPMPQHDICQALRRCVNIHKCTLPLPPTGLFFLEVFSVYQ
jgi:hypothetical protein